MSNMSLCRLKSLPGYGRSRLPETSPGPFAMGEPGPEHEEPGLLLDANLVLRAAIMLVLGELELGTRAPVLKSQWWFAASK
jgi:hypothetical protein